MILKALKYHKISSMDVFVTHFGQGMITMKMKTECINKVVAAAMLSLNNLTREEESWLNFHDNINPWPSLTPQGVMEHK